MSEYTETVRAKMMITPMDEEYDPRTIAVDQWSSRWRFCQHCMTRCPSYTFSRIIMRNVINEKNIISHLLWNPYKHKLARVEFFHSLCSLRWKLPLTSWFLFLFSLYEKDVFLWHTWSDCKFISQTDCFSRPWVSFSLCRRQRQQTKL